jgi:alkyl sulfatase BDS1-like metallo-beta-lactamase superfamily hydrolase
LTFIGAPSAQTRADRDLYAQPCRSFRRVRGIVSEDDVKSGKVEILAPNGFMDEAVSENVLAGGAMGRRAQYMYGTNLPKNATGQVDTGLGKATARGTITLLAPTSSITKPIETRRIDGIDFEFQLTRAPRRRRR